LIVAHILDDVLVCCFVSYSLFEHKIVVVVEVDVLVIVVVVVLVVVAVDVLVTVEVANKTRILNVSEVGFKLSMK
jgi:hypothetical protein